MPQFYFGGISEATLAQVDWRLIRIARHVLSAGIMDFSVREGYRGEIAQNAAFDRGASKLRFPQSAHNASPSRAVHFIPYPQAIDQRNPKCLKYFLVLGGIILKTAHELGIEVRWGRDWDSDMDLDDQTFNDFAHWEVPEQ